MQKGQYIFLAFLLYIKIEKMFRSSNIKYLTLILLAYANMSFSQDNGSLEINAISDFNFGTYVSGSVAIENTHCVVSTNFSQDTPRNNGDRADEYELEIESTSGASNFYIYLDGNTSEAGSRRIAIEIYHYDQLSGPAYHLLNSNIYENEIHFGQFRNCPDGDNSNIRVVINSTELAGKVSGAYSGTFNISAVGGKNMWLTTSGITFEVSISVEGGSQVKISSLDEINFGTYVGPGNLDVVEKFCIYSAATAGSYNISISSANPNASSIFNLGSITSSDKLKYSLSFIDDAVSSPNLVTSNSPINGYGDATSVTCNGSNNSTIGISISENDLTKAKSGGYRDVITLMVEPI